MIRVNDHVAGYSEKYKKTCIFRVFSLDPDNVYVVNITDPEEIKALSPRAINRTFHVAKQLPFCGRWYVATWEGSPFLDDQPEPFTDTEEFNRRHYAAIIAAGWERVAEKLKAGLAVPE